MAAKTRPSCTGSTAGRTSTPWGPCFFLMEDSLVARTMIPWGWIPSYTRPAEDLHNAVDQVKEIWTELGESPKHMRLSLLGV